MKDFISPLRISFVDGGGTDMPFYIIQDCIFFVVSK